MEVARTVRLGTRDVKYPSADLQVLDPCNHLMHDVEALRSEMEDKGYLYIRGLHDENDVMEARRAVLTYIHGLGDKLHKEHPLEEGVVREGCGLGCLPYMEGRNEISHHPAVLAVIQGRRRKSYNYRPFEFFKKYFNSDVKTFDFKWLRAMHLQGYTGAHVDNVYMSRGSPRLLTMWTPMGTVPVEMGVLAVCEGSHRLPGFQTFQKTYGNTDLEALGVKGTGWFTEDPFEITSKFGGQWKTTDFRSGDVLVFNMRWQPAEDALDPRFNGDFQKMKGKFGLTSKIDDVEGKEGEGEGTTLEALKLVWGI